MEKKPSERIKEIISTIDYGETNPALTAIVKYLDEQYEQETPQEEICDLCGFSGEIEPRTKLCWSSVCQGNHIVKDTPQEELLKKGAKDFAERFTGVIENLADTPKHTDKEQMDLPTMKILSEIAVKTGYSFLFGVDENVGDGVYLDVGYTEENPKEIYFQVCKDTPKHTDNWEAGLNELLVVYKLSEFSVSKEEIIQKVKSLLAKEREEVIKMVEEMLDKEGEYGDTEAYNTMEMIINKLKENI